MVHLKSTLNCTVSTPISFYSKIPKTDTEKPIFLECRSNRTSSHAINTFKISKLYSGYRKFLLFAQLTNGNQVFTLICGSPLVKSEKICTYSITLVLTSCFKNE